MKSKSPFLIDWGFFIGLIFNILNNNSEIIAERIEITFNIALSQRSLMKISILNTFVKIRPESNFCFTAIVFYPGSELPMFTEQFSNHTPILKIIEWAKNQIKCKNA